MKAFLIRAFPWVITLVALYYAFKGIRWDVIFSHIGEANWLWLLAALAFTCLSYLFRSRRWQSLFPEKVFHFWNSARVLFLGFFMNNILPARAGEFVRAHMGARLSGGTSRALVLATIASERLIDGLTISLMFVVFALGLGNQETSHELLYVACLFVAAGAAVLVLIVFKDFLFNFVGKLAKLIKHDAAHYVLEKLQVFVNGLTPLFDLQKLPFICVWSLIIWFDELLVYKSIGLAFSADLSWPQCVLFLVALNFASLIPAAPAGIGVIEAVTTAVLISIGVEREHALTMVIAQHVIQYLVVGVPGAVIMINWKNTIAQIRAAKSSDDIEAVTGVSPEISSS